MNHCKFVLVYVVIALAIACSTPEFLNSPKSDEVVLEVITTAKGMTYPKEGDLLDMRLYKSGRFEYDYYPEYNPPQFSSRNVLVTRQEAKLNFEQVNELIALAEQPSFLFAKEQYQSLLQHTDTTWTTTIKFTNKGREKKIVAVNFVDVFYDKEEQSKYPPSMIELFEKVEKFKANAIAKPSNYLPSKYNQQQ